jgi:hypothetical protein
MLQKYRIEFTAVLLALSGCVSFKATGATEVSPTELLNVSHNDTTDCLFYKGSDEHFHYIYRRETFRKTVGPDPEYKVRVEDLPLKNTFAVGEGTYPLFSTAIVEATTTSSQSAK